MVRSEIQGFKIIKPHVITVSRICITSFTICVGEVLDFKFWDFQQTTLGSLKSCFVYRLIMFKPENFWIKQVLGF